MATLYLVPFPVVKRQPEPQIEEWHRRRIAYLVSAGRLELLGQEIDLGILPAHALCEEVS
jgi:hypothetical protein